MTSRIGQYEILDLLGDGGMGSVYRGRDPRFDRPVAIKVLHPQLARDPGIVERFRSEAVIQAKLRHPSIVMVHDFVAEGAVLAIVMEMIEGTSLAGVLEKARGPMAPARAVRLMTQILSAMAYAHRQQLVHRDIKPSNVLVELLDGEEVAKVMDFGIAKILGTEKLKTATGATMGTLSYMSPEQVKSPKNVDARSDIYSLGAVLYEMLTGQTPFDADSEYEIQRQIVMERAPDPRHLVPALPTALAAVIGKALAKDPAARFQTCEEFREAIGQFRPAADAAPPAVPQASVAAPGPSATPDPSGPEMANRPPASSAPKKWAWVVPGLAFLALSAVLVGAAWLYRFAKEKGIRESAAAAEGAGTRYQAPEEQTTSGPPEGGGGARESPSAQSAARDGQLLPTDSGSSSLSPTRVAPSSPPSSTSAQPKGEEKRPGLRTERRVAPGTSRHSGVPLTPPPSSVPPSSGISSRIDSVVPPGEPVAASPIDLNSADETVLSRLPGVDPSTVKAIIAARPFRSVDDLKAVKGVGDAKFAAIRPLVLVSPIAPAVPPSPRPSPSNEGVTRRLPGGSVSDLVVWSRTWGANNGTLALSEEGIEFKAEKTGDDFWIDWDELMHFCVTGGDPRVDLILYTKKGKKFKVIDQRPAIGNYLKDGRVIRALRRLSTEKCD